VKADQSVVIENGKIVAIKDGFVPGDTVIDLKDSWVLPGLIDMHTHVSLPVQPEGADPRSIIIYGYLGRGSEIVLGALPIVKAVLMNGYTTVRDLGDVTSTVYDLRDAINKGVVVGPRILASEPQFSVDGGDYDAQRFGLRRELDPYLTNRGNCTGVEACTKAVREEINRGADVIKIREAGASLRDPKVESVESPEELNAIVATAHKLNRTVGAHVYPTLTGNRQAIEAGVDTIEHGPLDETLLPLMRQRGTAYTPTLIAIKIYADKEAQGEDSGLFGARDLYRRAVDSVGKAYRAGVMITFGSDLGETKPEDVWKEFGLLRDAGMPAEQTLRAATVNAAIKLGRGDSLGSIAPGKLADLIAVKSDPLADIKAMEHVSFVMKAGEVFKDE
jgi:imidazolonepropionase-like amidohydrolase